jgi:uncharacterized protein (TIGR04255 family)
VEDAAVAKSDTPTFTNPPLVEVVLGVQFDPIPSLDLFKLCAFIEAQGQQWPIRGTAPALDQIRITSGDEIVWRVGQSMQLVGGIPDVRLQCQVEDGAGPLLQLQNGWFCFNWRFGEGYPYPRFSKVSAGFWKHYEQFDAFLKSAGIGPVVPSLWEVTYVNHIRAGPLWSTAGDVGRVLPGYFPTKATPATGSSPELADASVSYTFGAGQKAGRLKVQVSTRKEVIPAKPLVGPADLILMSLVARGPIVKEDGPNGLVEGLNMGHNVVVESFVRGTSTEAHLAWGLQTC